MLPGIDDDDFAGSRYARMRWNTPLSAEHADLLLSQLDLHPGRARLAGPDQLQRLGRSQSGLSPPSRTPPVFAGPLPGQSAPAGA